MTRKDLNNNVLEVEHTDGTERWLVVKKTLHPKKVNLNIDPNSQKSIHQSILYHLSGAGSQGQQPKQRSPDLPLPSDFFQLVTEEFLLI